MTLTDVENLLAKRLGFDIHSVGPKAVETVVRRSMEEAGFSDPAAYARMLADDPDAWNRLVDRVVIPETWFFRDIAPFELAANLARARVQPRVRTGSCVFSVALARPARSLIRWSWRCCMRALRPSRSSWMRWT